MKKNVAVTKKKISANKKSDTGKPYLTKRILISAAKRGFHEAAEEAMQLMGYTIVAQGKWRVKKYADGRIEKLSLLSKDLRIDTEGKHEIRLD